MDKPTQYELDDAVEVLEAYRRHIEEHEPYASRTLIDLSAVIRTLEGDVDEIFAPL